QMSLHEELSNVTRLENLSIYWNESSAAPSSKPLWIFSERILAREWDGKGMSRPAQIFLISIHSFAIHFFANLLNP
ncbi:MAG: hypothetical protein ACRDBP_12285, partial [Luteolibacter sp.]